MLALFEVATIWQFYNKICCCSDQSSVRYAVHRSPVGLHVYFVAELLLTNVTFVVFDARVDVEVTSKIPL